VLESILYQCTAELSDRGELASSFPNGRAARCSRLFLPLAFRHPWFRNQRALGTELLLTPRDCTENGYR
jgi:hypothetical protein